MKNLFKYLFGLAFLLSSISSLLALGSGTTVVGGVMMVVMFSFDWFSTIFANLTTLVVELATIAWILSG